MFSCQEVSIKMWLLTEAFDINANPTFQKKHFYKSRHYKNTLVL